MPPLVQQLPTLNPQQLQGMQNLISQLGNTQPNINAISQRARNQFQTQTIPGLAERFTSLGSGAQRSSAFQGTLGSAGADLESQLAGLESNFGLQQQNLLAQLLGQKQFENIVQPEREGFAGPLAGGVGTGIGFGLPLLLSSYLGGTAGTAAGLTGASTGAAATGAAGAGTGGLLAGLGALASNPATLPILLGLLAAGGIGYGAYQAFSD